MGRRRHVVACVHPFWRRRVACVGILCAVAALACATPEAGRLRAEAPLLGNARLARAAGIGDVPFVAQRTDECGPAALAMVLAWNGESSDVDPLVAQLMVPARKGTLQSGLLAAARRRGFLAYELRGFDALLAEIAAGHPVIVLQNLAFAWRPVWHYALAIGYELDLGTVTLHSGAHASREVSLEAFERTWARAQSWGLVVLPAGSLPASAREPEYVRAVIGLERAQRMLEAERAYAAAAARWPRSSLVRIGLGNARYAQGDLAGAERALLDALELDPASVAARQNLAQVRAERAAAER